MAGMHFLSLSPFGENGPYSFKNALMKKVNLADFSCVEMTILK